jgi:lipopolysaccharide export system protein LptC
MSQHTASTTNQDEKTSLRTLLTLESRPRLRTLALGCTILAALYLLWHSDEPQKTSGNTVELRGTDEPDGFIINGSYTGYDKTGQVKIHFNSPRIEQFENNNLAVIRQPHAELYGQPGTLPWVVDADKGRLQQNDDLLYLNDNVRIVRDVDNRKATLTTTSLTLDNNAGTVYTDAPVEITDQTGVTRATGMKAWIDQRILELNSKVEGRYETGQ